MYALVLILEAFYFRISDGYDVYNDDYAAVNYLALKKNPARTEEEENWLWMREDSTAGFEQLIADLASLDNLNFLYNMYYSMQCLCVLGLIFEFISHIDFQKRLGLVADTLKSAAVELSHLLALLFYLILYTALLMMVIRGDRCSDYQTLEQAITSTAMAVVSGDLVRCEEASLSLSGDGVHAVILMLVLQFFLMEFLLGILGDNMGGTAEDNKERDATPSPFVQLYDIFSSALVREARGQPDYQTLLLMLDPYWKHLHKNTRTRRAPRNGSLWSSCRRCIGKATSALRRSRFGTIRLQPEQQASSLKLTDGTDLHYHDITAAILGLVQPPSDTNSVAQTLSKQGRKTRRDRRYFEQQTDIPIEELKDMVQIAVGRHGNSRRTERKPGSDLAETGRRTIKKKFFWMKTIQMYVDLKKACQALEEGQQSRIVRLCSMLAEDDKDLLVSPRSPR